MLHELADRSKTPNCKSLYDLRRSPRWLHGCNYERLHPCCGALHRRRVSALLCLESVTSNKTVAAIRFFPRGDAFVFVAATPKMGEGSPGADRQMKGVFRVWLRRSYAPTPEFWLKPAIINIVFTASLTSSTGIQICPRRCLG